MSLILSAMALGNLAVPCVPAADEAPLEAQIFATAALRQLSAASAALLLYRALVGSAHAWDSPVIRAVLRWVGGCSVACLVLGDVSVILHLTYPPPNPTITLAASVR